MEVTTKHRAGTLFAKWCCSHTWQSAEASGRAGATAPQRSVFTVLGLSCLAKNALGEAVKGLPRKPMLEQQRILCRNLEEVVPHHLAHLPKGHERERGHWGKIPLDKTVL